MAHPVCLTDAITLVGLGPFGERVNAQLAALLPGATQRDVAALDAEFAQEDGPVVLSLWRSSRALVTRADDLAYRTGRVLVPIVMEYPVLRIGPVIHPPYGPCFGCYTARRVQHNTALQFSEALEREYDTDAAFGPAGYLPAHARLAAALASDLMARAHQTGWAGHAGAVVAVELTSGTLSRSVVVRCGDCFRPAATAATSFDIGAIGRDISRRVGGPIGAMR
jgi:bacteriocin biosynthesis cyclodehydratase domain-containing protein